MAAKETKKYLDDGYEWYKYIDDDGERFRRGLNEIRQSRKNQYPSPCTIKKIEDFRDKILNFSIFTATNMQIVPSTSLSARSYESFIVRVSFMYCVWLTFLYCHRCLMKLVGRF